LIKVVRSDSYDFDMPAASLANVWSRGLDRTWLTKRAAVLSDIVKGIRPERGHQYIHLISMGAQEAYGPNRNGDGFNEKRGSFELAERKDGRPQYYHMDGGLVDYHRTFTKFANVFKHHKNDDPKLSIGDIVADAYNPEMKRGELIIKVPEDDEWMPHLQKLANGKDIPFSMACKVPYDVCTICGNRARSRKEYCKHAADHLSEIVKEGHQAYVINDAPKFFDISRVFRPADRIAWSLRKVASAGLVHVKSGAQLAEEEGLILPERMWDADSPYASAKLATAKKLADIEKLVDGVAQSVHNADRVKGLIAGCPNDDLPPEAMEVLQSARLGTALKGLSDAKICLSLRDFVKLVTGSNGNDDSFAGDIPSVLGVLPGVFSRLLQDGDIEECAEDCAYDPAPTAVPRRIKEVLGQLADTHSMDTGPATKRIKVTIIRGVKPKALALPPKLASLSSSDGRLAKEYAKYQLAFARAANDDLVTGLTAARNFTSI